MFEQPTTDLFPPQAWGNDAVEDAMVALYGQVSAAQCQWLCWVAANEASRGWEGTPAMASVLGYRCGMPTREARRTVALARRLQEMPKIRTAFFEGKLCYAQVLAMARVATPEIEDELIHLARVATGPMLERALRKYRWLLVSHSEAAQNEAALLGREARGLAYSFDEEGFFHLSGTFCAEAGLVIEAALRQVAAELKEEAAALEHPDSPTETTQRPWEARQADALLAICESVRDTERTARPGAARQEVVVHVDAALLSGAEPQEEPGEVAGESAGEEHGQEPGEEARQEPGELIREHARCELEGAEAPLAPESARRITCDATVVAIVEDADGQPLSVGRRTRSIPGHIRTALQSRDQGCVFPGCGATRYVEGHHIVHWAKGGETSLSNLLSLCWAHHVLLHEGGYRIVVGEPGRFAFLRPDGSEVGARSDDEEDEEGEGKPEVTYVAQLGFAVEPKDTLCQYSGGRMNLGDVIAGLYCQDGRFSGVPRQVLQEAVQPPKEEPEEADAWAEEAEDEDDGYELGPAHYDWENWSPPPMPPPDPP